MPLIFKFLAGSNCAPPRIGFEAEQVGLLNADTGGLKAGHGVIVRLDCDDDLRLLDTNSFMQPSMSDLKKYDFFKNTFDKSPHTDTPISN